MIKPKSTFSTIALTAVLFVCFFTFNSFGQTPAARPERQAEPNYEIVLHVLAASGNQNDKTAAVPPQLSNVVKHLKSMYTFSNYNLNLTYLQRVANTGSLEFKGVLSAAGQDVSAPIFSEFSIRELSTLPDAKGGNSISLLNFRFGQRVPVRTANVTTENGKSNAVVNYEQIGLSMRRIDLPLNSPTIIGNLSGSKPDELMFLILTIKSAE